MPLRYKIDVLEALKDAGYSSTRLRKEKLMGESYMSQLRHGEMVSWKTIETICRLLNCQPGDLVEYAPELDTTD
ncbi:MAG: helix-turn-helix domain-containing protein [Faecousia sp.]